MSEYYDSDSESDSESDSGSNSDSDSDSDFGIDYRYDHDYNSEYDSDYGIDSDYDFDSGFYDYDSDAAAMNDAHKHERWYTKQCKRLRRQLRKLLKEHSLWFDRHLLMLLTLAPPLLKSVRQSLHTLPVGTKPELSLDVDPSGIDGSYLDCLNPPSDEALLETASELARIASSLDSMKRLRLHSSTLASSILESCSGLEKVALQSCHLVTEDIRLIFSITTLRQINLQRVLFPDSESINAFCVGMESSAVKELSMFMVSFSPGRRDHVAMTLANCESLVKFSFENGTCPSFCDNYLSALSDNFDTKLERLRLRHWHQMEQQFSLDLHGGRGEASGLDAANVAKIRNLLKWNVQRRTCSPLFAAIGSAETDATRRQCLVEAFETVDIPVVFEYITTNQNNLIALIQRLGRSRKRQRED